MFYTSPMSLGLAESLGPRASGRNDQLSVGSFLGKQPLLKWGRRSRQYAAGPIENFFNKRWNTQTRKRWGLFLAITSFYLCRLIKSHDVHLSIAQLGPLQGQANKVPPDPQLLYPVFAIGQDWFALVSTWNSFQLPPKQSAVHCHENHSHMDPKSYLIYEKSMKRRLSVSSKSSTASANWFAKPIITWKRVHAFLFVSTEIDVAIWLLGYPSDRYNIIIIWMIMLFSNNIITRAS